MTACRIKVVLWLLLVGMSAGRASATIIHLDVLTCPGGGAACEDPNKGFHDPTTVTPSGGNSGTTLGERRRIAWEYAANRWASRLASNVEIRVAAFFGSLSCNSNRVTLGSTSIVKYCYGFAGAPISNVLYPAALANSLAHQDLNPGRDDMTTKFSSVLGTGCSFDSHFYYGLDGHTPSDAISFVDVAMHELGHGLGFQNPTIKSSGALFEGFIDDFSGFIFDENTAGPLLLDSDSQRAFAFAHPGSLSWVGSYVEADSGLLSAGRVDGTQRVRLDPSAFHWSSSLAPNVLMKPESPNGSNLQDFSTKALLALDVMRDIGWQQPCSTATDGQSCMCDLVSCVGDCDSNGSVSVSEIISQIDIVLGLAPISGCYAMDRNCDGTPTINEVIQSVKNDLTGCPVMPPSMATPIPLSVHFEIAPISGNPGDTKTFEVGIVPANATNPTPAALSLDLTFPTNIISTPSCVINSASLPSHMLDTNAFSSGHFRTLVVSTQPGEIHTFPVGATGVVVYTCTTQILAGAPVGTYSLTGNGNMVSDPDGNVVTSNVSVQGTITVGGSGGCSIVPTSKDQDGVWVLLLPAVVLLIARMKPQRANSARWLCSLVSACLLVSAAWAQTAAPDVDGAFTVTQPGTPDLPIATRDGPLVVGADLRPTKNNNLRWHAFNIHRSGNKVEGNLMVLGSTAIGVATFEGEVVSADGTIAGGIRDSDGNTVARIAGQISRTGLQGTISAGNGEQAEFVFIAPHPDAWAGVYELNAVSGSDEAGAPGAQWEGSQE